jgi:hypothetical protein
MIYKYEATNIGFDDEYDALTVAFGGLPDTDNYPTVYLMLQRSTDENEDDPGIEGVYAEWSRQEMSGYGCIRRFDLFRNKAEVKFTDSVDFYMPGRVGGESKGERLTELVIIFAIDGEKYVELKETLSAVIFHGCDCFTIHDAD